MSMSIFTNRIIQESYQNVYRKKNRFLKPTLHVCESEVEDVDKLIYGKYDPICVKHGFKKSDKDDYYNIEDNQLIKYKICYKDDSIICLANKHLVWFDLETGDKIDPPKVIEGDFDCSELINLTSLDGAPKYVGGNFACFCCDNLISLEGSPREVRGNFRCFYCKNLTSLEGAPRKVGGNFDCNRCKNLTSLKGSPQYVRKNFCCFGCRNLTSLEGAPNKVGRDFDCNECPNLTSLEGAPRYIGRNFSVPLKLMNISWMRF